MNAALKYHTKKGINMLYHLLFSDLVTNDPSTTDPFLPPTVLSHRKSTKVPTPSTAFLDFPASPAGDSNGELVSSTFSTNGGQDSCSTKSISAIHQAAGNMDGDAGEPQSGSYDGKDPVTSNELNLNHLQIHESECIRPINRGRYGSESAIAMIMEGPSEVQRGEDEINIDNFEDYEANVSEGSTSRSMIQETDWTITTVRSIAESEVPKTLQSSHRRKEADCRYWRHYSHRDDSHGSQFPTHGTRLEADDQHPKSQEHQYLGSHITDDEDGDKFAGDLTFNHEDALNVAVTTSGALTDTVEVGTGDLKENVLSTLAHDSLMQETLNTEAPHKPAAVPSSFLAVNANKDAISLTARENYEKDRPCENLDENVFAKPEISSNTTMLHQRNTASAGSATTTSDASNERPFIEAITTHWERDATNPKREQDLFKAEDESKSIITQEETKGEFNQQNASTMVYTTLNPTPRQNDLAPSSGRKNRAARGTMSSPQLVMGPKVKEAVTRIEAAVIDAQQEPEASENAVKLATNDVQAVVDVPITESAMGYNGQVMKVSEMETSVDCPLQSAKVDREVRTLEAGAKQAIEDPKQAIDAVQQGKIFTTLDGSAEVSSARETAVKYDQVPRDLLSSVKHLSGSVGDTASELMVHAVDIATLSLFNAKDTTSVFLEAAKNAIFQPNMEHHHDEHGRHEELRDILNDQKPRKLSLGIGSSLSGAAKRANEAAKQYYDSLPDTAIKGNSSSSPSLPTTTRAEHGLLRSSATPLTSGANDQSDTAKSHRYPKHRGTILDHNEYLFRDKDGNPIAPEELDDISDSDVDEDETHSNDDSTIEIERGSFLSRIPAVSQTTQVAAAAVASRAVDVSNDNVDVAQHVPPDFLSNPIKSLVGNASADAGQSKGCEANTISPISSMKRVLERVSPDVISTELSHSPSEDKTGGISGNHRNNTKSDGESAIDSIAPPGEDRSTFNQKVLKLSYSDATKMGLVEGDHGVRMGITGNVGIEPLQGGHDDLAKGLHEVVQEGNVGSHPCTMNISKSSHDHQQQEQGQVPSQVNCLLQHTIHSNTDNHLARRHSHHSSPTTIVSFVHGYGSVQGINIDASMVIQQRHLSCCQQRVGTTKRHSVGHDVPELPILGTQDSYFEDCGCWEQNQRTVL
ncbi:MAG: hypothetical protein J3Q66DRAFT_386183 [Benniella sp.]|nr:MAG: hypothetical protein J3Q66DRAFT_386183 [Benniella sp.]